MKDERLAQEPDRPVDEEPRERTEESGEDEITPSEPDTETTLGTDEEDEEKDQPP